VSPRPQRVSTKPKVKPSRPKEEQKKLEAEKSELSKAAITLKRQAEATKTKNGDPTVESLDMYLRACLKWLELSELEDDQKAIALYRQIADLLKYTVHHLLSKKETFRLILGYKCIAVSLYRSYFLNKQHLKTLKRSILSDTSTTETTAVSNFVQGTGDLMEALDMWEKSEGEAQKLSSKDLSPDSLPNLLTVKLKDFITYIRTQLEKLEKNSAAPQDVDNPK